MYNVRFQNYNGSEYEDDNLLGYRVV
jgi:hypothetical protein